MDALRRLCCSLYIGCIVIGLFALAVSLSVIGCVGSGVSYSYKDKCLIAVKNDAVLSCCDTVIGDEKQVDIILLKKGRDGLVRTVYFNVSKDSNMAISEDDFRLDFVSGRFSLLSTNKIFVLSTNQYDMCQSNGPSIVWDDYKKIVINEVDVHRITYFMRRDAIHVILIDAKLSDGQYVQIPLGIIGMGNKDPVLLRVEKREWCDIVIQENLYEFGVF